MKTRTGFVSNSSSSSFIAYGAATTNIEAAIDIIEKLAPGELTSHFDLPIDELLTAIRDWDIELHDIGSKLQLPFEILHCHEEETIIFGLVKDGLDEDYGINRVSTCFKQDKLDEITTIFETIGEKVEFLFGRYSC